MRHEVAGVHLFGSVEVGERGDRVVTLEHDLAKQDVRAGRIGLQKDGLLERSLGLGVVAGAGICVSEAVRRLAGSRGLRSRSLFELSDRDIRMLASEGDLAEESVGRGGVEG